MLNRKFGCQDGIFGNTIYARVRILSSSNSEFIYLRAFLKMTLSKYCYRSAAAAFGQIPVAGHLSTRVYQRPNKTLSKKGDIDNRNRKFDNSKSRPPKMINNLALLEFTAARNSSDFHINFRISRIDSEIQ